MLIFIFWIHIYIFSQKINLINTDQIVTILQISQHSLLVAILEILAEDWNLVANLMEFEHY